MRNGIILSLALLFFVTSLFANGSEVELKPQLIIFQGIEYSALDMRAHKNDISAYANPFYSRTNLRASYGIKKNNFTFTPYVQERLEFFLSKDKMEEEAYAVSLRGRNRFYIGTIFSYYIKELVNLTFNLEHLIQSDFKKNNLDYVPTVYRLMPTVSLSASHDFGLKWSLLNSFGFYFDEQSIYANGGKIYQFYMEGLADFSFDFLRHIKEGLEHQVMVIGDYSYFFTNDYPYSDVDKRIYNGLMGLGFAYSYKGISPNFLVRQWHAFDDYVANTRNHFGFQVGLNFIQERYSVGATYIGGRQIRTSEQRQWHSSLKGTFSLKF